MRKLIPLIALLLAAASFTSCVSNKKYLAAKSRISGLQQDSLSLESRLAQAQNRLNQLEGKVDQMQASNQFTSNQLNRSQEEIASQRQKLEQLQALIDQQKKNTEMIRAKMAEALKGFSSDQLSVATKNGKVYVSMQESLLFPSGSATINAKGKEALGTLATVLNQNMDINVEVEGHTDSIPIKQRYEDNLALSVARSTAITRILTNEYQVAPERLTASGRSQYEPIADNSTPEGRARNRRTEIILEPKLDELMRLIENSGTQRE
jgi:chemotaxis protein MotB